MKIIIGASGNSAEVLDFTKCAYYADDVDYKIWWCDLPYYGKLNALKKIKKPKLIFGIGSLATIAKRKDIIQRIGVPKSGYVNAIHPSVNIGTHGFLGTGNIILAGCNIGSANLINNFIIMLQNSVIGHDSTVGDYSIICAGVTISGNVTIGKSVFIGSGAVIRDRIIIGDNVIIGCGSVVVKDVPRNSTVYGNPAKVFKPERREG